MPRIIDRASGLYNPESKVWQINRELLVTLAGSRALLMELAHPLIAAGVAQHSDFRRRPLKRLVNTIRTMFYLTFGDEEAAAIVLAHVRHCHRPVRGQLLSPVDGFPAGTGYDARDPALRLWVFATLVDSILVIHDHFVRPLTDEEKFDYYVDSRRMALALGIPDRVIPADYAEFCSYVASVYREGTLVVSGDARNVIESLFRYPFLGCFLRFASFPGIGLLPDDLRQDFGLNWTLRHQQWLLRLGRFSRTLRRMLPGWMCVYPRTW